MGQYHFVVNIDKKQFLHPHKLGDGLKLMEFACSAQGTMTALAILLAASSTEGGRGGGDFRGIAKDKPGAELNDLVGSWAGDRLAIIGDYAESSDVPGFDAKSFDPGEEGEVKKWEDISYKMFTLMLRGDSYLGNELRSPWGDGDNPLLTKAEQKLVQGRAEMQREMYRHEYAVERALKEFRKASAEDMPVKALALRMVLAEKDVAEQKLAQLQEAATG